MNNKISLNLNYHDFTKSLEKRINYNRYSIEFQIFSNQLDLLFSKKNAALSSLLDPESLGYFNYSLTFDDGFISNLYVAEELARRNLVGTFFIIKNECCSNKKYIDVKGVKELSNLGMEIGSHSCSHRHLNRLPKQELINELHDSKVFLEDIISKPVNSVAFPGGNCGSREFDAALKEGYLINRTCICGVNELPLVKGIIKSINIKGNIDRNSFIKLINIDQPYLLRLKLRQRVLALPKYTNSKLKGTIFDWVNTPFEKIFNR